MRTIKFRVWDNELGFMYAGTTLEEMLQDPPKWRDYYVWEQFTGLHDKNGVEIYEGDRVDFNGSKYFVAIGNYEYQESWDSSHMVFTNGIYFIKIGAYQILNDFNKYNMDYVEVIGNIHEEEMK